VGETGLPPLKPESPWYGYSLGEWNDTWESYAKRVAAGDYLHNGRLTWPLRREVDEP